MYERFTDRARKILQLANQEAQRFSHEYIGTEHILLGLVKEGAGVAANVLKNLDIDLPKIRLEVEKIVQYGPDTVTMGKLPQTPRAKKVIEYSIEEAKALKHNYVGTEHLLLGLLREEEGVAAQALMNLGLKLEDVREEVLKVLGHDEADRPAAMPGVTTVKTPALDSLGEDLTALARQDRLEPFVGRANEIDRALMVLGCREAASLLLVGPPGVGKASLIRGLARLAAGDNPPEVLRGRRVVRVSLRALVFHVRDDSEKLLRVARDLVKDAQRGDILLAVEDLFAFGHDSRLFKGALDAGHADWVATATPQTYPMLLRDGIFSRNWQPVFVGPPPAEEVVMILRAHCVHYEDDHGMQIGDDALTAAADLSERHLTEGAQPARALRLLDQAAVLFRMRHAPAPPDTRALDSRIEELDAAKVAAITEQDFEKAAHLRDQAEKVRQEKGQLLAPWGEKPPRVAGILDAAAVEAAVTKLTGVQFRGSEAIREKREPGPM